jgi:hypothetical protein
MLAIIMEQYRLVHESLIDEIHKVRTDLLTSLLISNIVQESLGRVSLSIDVWSNGQLQSFLGVSVHWISRHKNTRQLQLRSGMLAFRHFNGSHSGENMARHLFDLLKRTNLLCKVFTITNYASSLLQVNYF